MVGLTGNTQTLNLHSKSLLTIIIISNSSTDQLHTPETDEDWCRYF